MRTRERYVVGAIGCAVVAAAVLLRAAPAFSLAAEDAVKAAEIAQRLLDAEMPTEKRVALVREHGALSVQLVEAMTRDLAADAKEEYRRIPWIWRVAVEAGRRNESKEIVRFLDFALPQGDGALKDWQAVVIGGGIINGISLSGPWPGERLERLMHGDATLQQRWRRALDLASAMADDDEVPSGTRYDALRMVGLDSWDQRGGQLFRYLLKGVDAELQQGAISALADNPAAASAQALLSGMSHYSPGNREFALDALLRDETRRAALTAALADGRVSEAQLGESRKKRLTQAP